jgi:hypothetical protein
MRVCSAVYFHFQDCGISQERSSCPDSVCLDLESAVPDVPFRVRGLAELVQRDVAQAGRLFRLNAAGYS